MTGLGKYAVVFAVLVGTGEAAWFLRGLRGIVITGSAAERPPPISARSAATGWRPYHFWHSGFSGGK